MMIFLVMFGSSVVSQTASLPVTTASPNELVTIPLNVTNFSSIGSIMLSIQIDPTVLSFAAISGGPAGMVAGVSGSTLTLSWSGPPYYTNLGGTLVNLIFTYNGPGVSTLNFNPAGCEVVQMPGFVPVTVAYTNGNISPDLTNAQKGTLMDQVCAETGSAVSVPVKFEGFPLNVGSLTQKIQYDPAKLTFTSVTGAGSFNSVVFGGASGGIITVVWSNFLGADINYATGNYYQLNFTYTGATSTNLTFVPGNIITDNATNNIEVSYFNGTVSVNPLAVPTITPSGPLAFCQGGSVTLTSSAATSYLWSNGATTQAITVNTGGNYSVTVSDGTCFKTSAPVAVTVNPLPVVSVTPDPAEFCAGGNVTLTANASGGTAPYSYLWTGGGMNQTLNVTVAGTYTVTVTDGNLCAASASRVVTQNPLPVVNITPDPAEFCLGGSVVLTANASGGTGAVTYLWSNAQTTQSITVNAAGSYNVTVTDTKGCTAMASRNVTQNPLPAVTINPSVAEFCAGSTIDLEAVASLGTPGYTYLWSNGATTPIITVSAAGNYSVVVTDSKGCTASASKTVTQNPLPVVNITPDPAEFCAGGSVLLTANASGGTGSISYLWSTGATTQTLNVTVAGTYTVTVTDSKGCTAVTSRNVTVNPLPSVSIAPDPAEFCAGGSVTLVASATGGTGAKTYLWSNMATTPSITVNVAGSYDVVVTDTKGCTATASRTVVQNPLPTVTINPNPAAFCTGSSVVLTANGAGGTGSYLYSWSNGATTQAITVNVAGTYTVIITDSKGCTATASRSVTENPLPAANLVTNSPVCVGGTIMLTAYPQSSDYTLIGVGPNAYNHVFAGPTYIDEISPVGLVNGGTYTLYVTNNLTGCATSFSTDVVVNPLPVPAISASPSATVCEGTVVTLTATGGTSYLWSTGATTASITTTTAGTYTVTVTALGCSASTSINVVVNPNPVATITPNGPTTFCAGGSVVLTASAGSSWLWSTSATTQAITVNTSGSYTVIVTNSFGCTTTSAPVVVTVNPLPTPTITPNPAAFCAGGSVVLTAGGGVSYLWSTGATTAAITVSVAGTYSVTVTNAQGCTAVATRVVTQNPLPTPVITPSGPTTFCAGGSVVLTASGGVSYLWSTGATTAAITVTTSGNYTVIVTDANGCQASTSQSVTVLPLPVPTLFTNSPVCVGGNLNLWSTTPGTLYVFTGPGFYTSGVNNNTTTGPVNLLNEGTYTVTITGSNGCTASTSTWVDISEPTVGGTVASDQTICSGSTPADLTLTGNLGNVVRWEKADNSSFSGAVTINVTTTTLPGAVIGPLTQTTYFRSVVKNGGCAEATPTNNYVMITVSPQPTLSISYTGSPFCNNNATPVLPVITQSNTSTSGTFVSTPAGLIINSTTGAITPLGSGPGTYTVTLTKNGINGCSGMSISASTQVTITEAPSATIYYLNGPVFCSNGSVATMVLTGTTGGVYASTAGLSINPTTGNVNIATSTPGTYTVTYTIAAANGCAQYTTTCPITITQLPAATIAYTGTPYCSNAGTANVTRTGSAGGTYSAPGGLSINTSTGAVNLGLSTPGTYTVTYTMPAAGSCPAQYAYASITITQMPTATISYGSVPYCSNVTPNVILPARTGAMNGTFTAPAGLVIDATTGGVTLATSTAGTYVVTYTVPAAGGCPAFVTTAPITIYLAPAPTLTSNAPICTGGLLILTATPATGISQYAWSGPASFQSIGTVNIATLQPATYPLHMGTYTVVVTSAVNGCTATASTFVEISEPTIAGNITPSNATVCTPTNSTLLTIGGYRGSVVRWEYSTDNGLSWMPIASTSYTYTAVNLQVTTMFHAIVKNGGCPEATTNNATITVVPIPTASIVYPNTPYCSNAGTATVVLTGTPGGYYSGPTGLVIVPQTGAVDLAASTPGTYTVTYTIPASGSCPEVKAYAPITITLFQTATITYGATPSFCTNTGFATPSITGTTGGIFSAPAGLAINSATGVVTLASSTPGTYTVTYTIPGANGCPDSYAYAPITIRETPVPTASSNSPVCEGGTLFLYATPTTGISNYEWNGPGFYSSSSVHTASLTPMTQQNAGNYLLQVIANNGCVATTSTTVSVAPTTQGGTAGPNQTLCSGSVMADLHLTGNVGNVLHWLKSSNIGFTNPVILPVTSTTLSGSYVGPLTANTFFRAVVQSGTCASAQSGIAVIVVNPLPSAPGVTVVNNCGNSVLTATGYTGTLLWSNGATTPSITVTTPGIYTVVQTVLGCTSAPGSGTAAPKEIPVAPTVTVVNNCGSSTLTASGYTGALLWSTGETTPSITVLVGGSYTVNQTVNGCVSPNATGIAAPKIIPAAPVVTVVDECGQSVLTATGVTGTLLWSTGATTTSIVVTTPGIYTVNQTVNGCVSADGSGTAAPKAIPGAPDVTVENFLGYSVLTASNYTGTLLWSTGATTASINVTVAGTYQVTQTVNGCVSPAGSGTAAPIATATISGFVRYKNSYATPMNGVTVTLKNSGGTIIGTTVTSPMGGNGYYQFTGVTPGTYRLQASYNGTWGGNNATDALRVLQTAVNINPLTGLNLLAGDVNASGLPLTALDAAMINNRVVGFINSYPAGNWIFDDITFTPIHASVTVNIDGLCYGDVDGSFIPSGMKAASFLNAVDDEVMNVIVNQPFNYQITSNELAQLGAMTLFLNYDQNQYTVEKVTSSVEGMKINMTEGRIAIAWANLTALSRSNDEPIIAFEVTAKNALSEPTAVFTIDGGSEFADPDANRIENFGLKMAKVITPAVNADFFLYNYPNPFKNGTEIVYSIPEDGKVRLVLTNLYGQPLRTLVDQTQTAGTYKVKIEQAEGYLAPGVYLYRLELEGTTETLTKTNKMLLTR